MERDRFWRRTTAAAPVRVVHLGLGAFARAHLAAYTEVANRLAPPGGAWGIAGFPGRSGGIARSLRTQEGQYAVLVRHPDRDEVDVVRSVSAAYDGDDVLAWRDLLARPEVGVVSLTVTEAGYRRAADGSLDTDDLDVLHDLDVLWRGGEVPLRTAPGRVVDGLRARRAAQAGAIAVLSCDNLPDNGQATRRVVLDLAALADPALAGWIEQRVSFVSSMVDRITPATNENDRELVRALLGREDRAPVVTEPFREWVLQGEFPAGRPAWECAGARFVDDLRPYEERKLWLLNAGHSLLAYGGLPRGLATVAEAFADVDCRRQLEALWAEAREILPLPGAEIDRALADLRKRFGNARIEHRLAQIARDGAQKLPVRVLAVAAARQQRGLPVGVTGAGVIAAWIRHLLTADGELPSQEGKLAAAMRDRSAVECAELVVRELSPAYASPAPLVAAVAGHLGVRPLAAV